ncbi:XRE family transcriptional regulator [Rhodococcus opacus RKJ300 = JCM 13270]|uniref:XRE family transcriptional regulator n=1 Tax=Rhodococcus opacus RKJ300 = JCM 13270 TaxID=1165867 RepID=I0WC28_RHOOP|nr:XRE family transcriptional regulator [Rhodococcus opacus RKJ300 = JCM 13270]
MVLRLAESMELTLRERNELLLAAGFAPAFPESPLDDEALRPVQQALETILDGHLPYPVMVVRPHGILVVANRAFEVFHEGVDPALLAPPVNVFRLALHPDGNAPRVRNLPERGRHITEHLRAQLAQSPDPALEALLAELESYLPPLPEEADVLGFAVPLELGSADGDLRLITTLTSFATASDVTLAELHPREVPHAPPLRHAVPVGLRTARCPRRRGAARAARRRVADVRAEEGGCRLRKLTDALLRMTWPTSGSSRMRDCRSPMCAGEVVLGALGGPRQRNCAVSRDDRRMVVGDGTRVDATRCTNSAPSLSRWPFPRAGAAFPQPHLVRPPGCG